MNSDLNPEAPEFYPNLTSVTQDGYVKVQKTIKSCNTLPSGASHNLFKTSTNFNSVEYKLRENVVVQSNLIITVEIPRVHLKSNDNEYTTEKITDANDSILDRVNTNIDSLDGVNKPNEAFIKGVKKNVNISSWNNTPVVSTYKVGATSLLGAKNITRPQLTFKDTIDNSETLWVPKISDKPNNIKPLALKILYNKEGEAVGYEHPYKIELNLYHPPSKFIDADTEPPKFPKKLEDTKLTYVETEAQLDKLLEHLTTVSELAVDIEHHSYRTYQGITCLIQISTNDGGDFIIDTLAIREHIHKLNVIFTDPEKIKVLHGADSDVLWLQRDFGVYIVGLFDTHQAAKVLNLTGLSLKHILMRYCNVNTDKRHQLADWRIRPLPEEMIEYARMDTHYLLYIWRMMKSELLERDSGGAHLLLSVFEKSRRICGYTYNKEVIHENSHMPLYLRSKKIFNTQQMAALKILYKWRDENARLLDESTIYLLPNHMLLALAENLPREVQGVNGCCNPMPPFVKQNLITIHRMILSCREMPVEPQLYQMPASIHSMVNVIQSLPAYNVHDLSQYPDFVDEHQVNVVQLNANFDGSNEFKPDIKVFKPAQVTDKLPQGFVSTLNADAKLFIPPYDRYRKYRTLAQVEEIKEYKDKEAKITAISKGNELIKAEVLAKLQHTKEQLEKSEEAVANETNDTDEKKTAQRKRKMTPEKNEQKELPEKAWVNKKELNKAVKKVENGVVPYKYKDVNYNKFYENTARSSKMPKAKFNKHK